MTTVWIIRAGIGSKLAASFVEHEVVALGWPDTFADLRQLSRWQLVERLETEKYPTPDLDADELIDYRDQVMGGDLVVTPDAVTRELVVGQIAGPYDYDTSTPIVDPEDGVYRHVRKVDWWGRGSRDDVPEDLRKDLHWRRAIRRLPRAGEWTRIIEELRDDPRGPADPKPRAVRTTSTAGGITRRSTSPRKAPAPKTSPPPVGQVCPGCQLRRPSHQFIPSSTKCADCRADE